MADIGETSKAFLIIAGSKVFPIEKTVTKIGRSYDNDLILQYPQISRKHAELRYTHGHFEIVDIGSTGGTLVNGVKIINHTLSKGDVITLVNLHLVFGLDAHPDLSPASIYHAPQDHALANKDTKTLTNIREKPRK